MLPLWRGFKELTVTVENQKPSFHDELYLSCLRCGLCSASCPVYRETLVESDSPRGRVALVRALNNGELEPSARYADRIYRCTLCAACEKVCPSGVGTEELFLEAREDLAGRGMLGAPTRRLADGLLAAHNISGEDNQRRLIWTENLERAPLGANKKTARAVYFVGCVSSFFPASYSIPQALSHVMEAAGLDYALMGENEWCCGYPLLAAGMSDQAQELMAHNLAQVKALGAEMLITGCPSCYYMWRTVYPERLGELGIRVLHATEWLDEALAQGQLTLQPLSARVTYHDPCDLGRKSGLYEPPRQVLKRIPGVELVEMSDHHANALCCGGGGNLESYNGELVTALSARRLDQAKAVEAQYLVSACQQCKRTLASAARRAKARLRVMDVVELVEKQL